MFEDALMESGNRIKTKSRYWSLLTLGLNSGALIALIIWPLLHPQALPKQALATLLVAPAPPPPPPPPQVQSMQTRSNVSEAQLNAPSKIPRQIAKVNEPLVSQLSPLGVRGMEGLADGSGVGDIMTGLGHASVVTTSRPEKVKISSGVMAGNLVIKVAPQYPAIAKAARIQGAVVLAATISKTGTIQNLRVISGPPMLQQAALDAVSSWHYKPYLLNGEPVEVETTVNLIFTLGN